MSMNVSVLRLILRTFKLSLMKQVEYVNIDYLRTSHVCVNRLFRLLEKWIMAKQPCWIIYNILPSRNKSLEEQHKSFEPMLYQFHSIIHQINWIPSSVHF